MCVVLEIAFTWKQTMKPSLLTQMKFSVCHNVLGMLKVSPRFILTLVVSLLCLCKSYSQGPSEEVFFYPDIVDGVPGARILNLETKVARWWFPHVSSSRVSPDGQMVAYVFSGFVHLVKLDGLEPKIIYSAIPSSSLLWSSDGERIAFMEGFLEKKITIISKDGTFIKSIDLKADFNYQGGFDWSPDDRYFVVVGQSSKREDYICTINGVPCGPNGSLNGFVPSSIFLVDAESGDLSPLLKGTYARHFLNGTVDSIEYGSPAWSPDGSNIAAAEFKNGGNGVTSYSESNLVVIPFSSRTLSVILTASTEVPSTTSIVHPPLKQPLAWSPDGFEIAYGKGIWGEGANSELHTTTLSGQTRMISDRFPRHLQWTILNPGPKLEIAVFPDQPIYDVDQDLEIKITVTHPGDNPATYTFENGLFTQDPEPEESESPIVLFGEVGAPETFVLSEDDPERVFTISAVAEKPGVVNIKSMLTVTPTEGSPYGLEDESSIVVSPLVVKLKALPLIDGKPIKNYELDEDKNPTDEEGNSVNPKIEVTVENLSNQPVNAFLQGVDPRARDDSSVVGRIKTLGDFPIDLGTLIKGTPKTQEIDLQLIEDGRFEFSALVTGVFKGTTSQFNVAKKAAKIAVGEPYPVEIEMEFVRTPTITNQSDGAFFVSPGGEIKFLAVVNNLTSNSTLYFKGIEAEKHRNAFGAVLTSEDGNLIEPPFVHDHQIDANSAVVLSGIIKTDPNGAPTGSVKWILPDDAYLIDDKTKERTDLTEDDFLVTTEIEGWLDEENSLRVIQDFSRPFPTELTSLESAGLITGNFTKGALISMAKWGHDTFDAIGGIGRVLGTISADPSLLSDALGEGARAVWETAEYIHLGWSNMTPDQKEALILDATKEIYRRSLLFVSPPFDTEEYNAAITFTRQATYGLFGGVTDAYESDDPARIAELYGNITGNIGMEVITALLPTPKFTRYVDGAELANLAKAADNIRSLNTQQKILQSVPAGPITRQMAIDGWGMGGKHLDDVQEFLGQLGMKGYARERAPRSITLSEVLDEAVLKPQSMKPKGFSDLDRLMLGNDVPTVKGKNGADLDLDAITVVMWPPENALIRTRLQAAGETEDTIKAVLARADSRRKEYKKRFPEFQEYKKDGIPVEFDYKSNDSIPTHPNNPAGATRSFDYETIDTTSGARIHVPKMGNAADELRYITGDVDWIHFSWLDGTPLDSETAGILYEIMERCCGIQHGETVTWINKGQAVFAGKAEQIGEYLVGPGQKALIEVTGDGIRAVRVSPKLTRFAKDARNHLIFFDGGTKSLKKAAKAADLENAFAVLIERLPPRKVILPFLWFTKSATFDDPTIDGQDYSYSDDPNAVIARQGEDENLEYFDGIAWLPWDQKLTPDPFDIVAAQGLSAQAGVDLNLTPTSILLEGTPIGANVLPLADFPTLWPEQLEGRVNKWFEVGDTIVIAPGTPQQELRRIVSLEPLTLNYPLDNSHTEDTMVSILPEVLVDRIDTSGSIRFTGVEIQSISNRITFEFAIPYNSPTIFEISSDLNSWMPIAPDTIEGGLISGDAVRAIFPGERIHINLKPNDTPESSFFLRW